MSDCDEVYNYWEPLYHILYNDQQHGSNSHMSLQTWEYAHEYALRTFAYLWPLAGFVRYVWTPFVAPHLTLAMVTSIVPFLTDSVSPSDVPDRLLVLMIVRAMLATLSAICELWMLRSIYPLLLQRQLSDPKATQSTTLVAVNQQIVLFWLSLVMLTTTGMTHASGALLPSSTFMIAYMICAACYLQSRYYLFVLVAVTTTLATGWPFGVIVLAPLGVAVLYETGQQSTRGLFQLGIFTVFATAAIQTSVMSIDYQYYGKWTSPTYNIFQYNAAGGGDELYGVEPTSYYVKNLALNLTPITAGLGIGLALPIAALRCLGQRRSIRSSPMGSLFVLLSPLIPWLCITVPRPHKEERFMFPIYPLVVVGALLTLDYLYDAVIVPIMGVLWQPPRTASLRFVWHMLVWIPVGFLSWCRTMALSRYYSAPLTIYMALAAQTQSNGSSELKRVCTCGEWYRFPGTFFLPTNLQLGFLPSSFHGQLPQPFTTHGPRASSQAELQPFNDQNQEVMERYETDVSLCEYMVDLADGECLSSFSNVEFEEILRVPFLDAERTSTLFRTLYIPVLHDRAIAKGQLHYQDYVLYHQIN